MIKAIIFDCFGVLATDGWLSFRQRYLKDNPALYEEVTKLNDKVDMGLLTFNDFIRAVANTVDITREEARRQIDRHVPNEELFDYIKRELKPKYKLGILSNAGDNWLNEIFTSEQVALFDAIVLSYEIGVIKPDSKMYQSITNKLGVKTDEGVFIDDQERYAEAAKKLGMQAIHYRDFEQMKKTLEPILANG